LELYHSSRPKVPPPKDPVPLKEDEFPRPQPRKVPRKGKEYLRTYRCAWERPSLDEIWKDFNVKYRRYSGQCRWPILFGMAPKVQPKIPEVQPEENKSSPQPTTSPPEVGQVVTSEEKPICISLLCRLMEWYELVCRYVL
jgi:hypothetical protein